MATKVQNLDRLKRRLRRIPVVMNGRIQAARVKGAQELVALQKRVVPKRTGALAQSIGYRIEGQTSQFVLGGSSSIVKEGAVVVGAGDEKAWYAALVEFGTPPHPQGGMFKGTWHPGTTGTNFFFGSYRLLKRRLISRIKREATKGAREAARR